MRAVLALAFLALARAAIIEVPIINDDFKYVDPMWTSSMFAKFGLKKPLYDDVSSWGKSIGVAEDPMVLNYMKSYYDKPALVFFQHPSGKVVGYYAHDGIDKPNTIPDMRTALYGLYGASDKMSINFRPDHMLGQYKTVLPGHFFEPTNTIEFSHFLNDMPVTADHVTFKPTTNTKDFWNKFDIEDLPKVYKHPVTLDISEKHLLDSVTPFSRVSPFTGFSDVSAAVPFGHGRSGIIPVASRLVSDTPFTGFSDVSAAVPFGYERSSIIPKSSHFVSGMPFTGFSDVSAAVPFGYERSSIIPKSSHFVSGMPFTGFSDFSGAIPFGHGKSIFSAVSPLASSIPFAGYRSELGVSPAVKSAAYHVVKADMPYFTAAPATGFVDSAAASDYSLVKSPLHAGLSATGLTPVHAFADTPSATHFLTSPFRTTPTFTSAFPLSKSGFKCVNCAGAEHAMAHAGAFPLFKTFGAADAYKSAFPGLSAEPTITFGAEPAFSFGASPALVKAVPVTSSLYAPSVGLTSSSGLVGSPLTAWNKY